MNTGDRRAVTRDCRWRPLTGPIQAGEPAGAAVADAGVLEQHINDHHQGDQCHASGR